MINSPIDSFSPDATQAQHAVKQANQLGKDGETGELREKFDEFVGQTLFGQMLKSMRSTQDKPAYFHGGRGEEVFQSELDHLLVQEMTKASAKEITGPMFEQFTRSKNRTDQAANQEKTEGKDSDLVLNWRQQDLLQAVATQSPDTMVATIDFVA
ncbi:MAG: hypothetical protein COA78_17385 [Blastopirellula sp.]|nr:MAG: hypothetical protein COA78_17385 [Blastopirellula sp.]